MHCRAVVWDTNIQHLLEPCRVLLLPVQLHALLWCNSRVGQSCTCNVFHAVDDEVWFDLVWSDLLEQPIRSVTSPSVCEDYTTTPCQNNRLSKDAASMVI